MDRRTFLKTLASFGASAALPINLVTASEVEIDTAWIEAARTWDLMEVGEFRTLWYANFEEPATRYEAYGFCSGSHINEGILESHEELYEPIQALYRDYLRHQDPARDEVEVDNLVSTNWYKWYEQARGKDLSAIERIVDRWLSQPPDPCSEIDDDYTTDDAQGATYKRFEQEDSELLEALGIVIVEGCCPGSYYYAAELHTEVEKANRIAAERGWSIRFVYQGEDFVRYDRKPLV